MVIFGKTLMMLAGLGCFLLGMQLISRNLQKLAGGATHKMLARVNNNKLAGIGIGAGAGVILESSSATTVILLSLVNAGIVNLLQATLIIMGANVGSTLTVLVFSLNYLPIGEFFAFFALIGAGLVMSAKTDKTRRIGFIIASFGLIFIGLSTMAESVNFLKDSERFAGFISSLQNPFLLVLTGALFSGIIQSGTATTGVVITLSQAGIMPVVATFYIILGSNVGTCMTAIIASLGSGINAKRTAFIHLLFNSLGVVLFLPILLIFGEPLCELIGTSLSPAVVVAYFHVTFNLITTIVLVPFVKHIVRFTVRVMPDKQRTTHSAQRTVKD
ncbi:MAG: Na/Pi symporter [Firmicutes bacterium]|nr:Na/Pi symporter [Bacillota bacterium]